MTKIMLVEDDNNLREIYEARLSAEGFEIATAQDGEAALAIAGKEKPDLIISDVMMPKISGFEMLDILRNTDALKNVKIIMLTALSQAEDNQRANSLGADRYLVKSQVTLEDIVKAAHELLDDPSALDQPAPGDTPEEPAADVTEQPAATSLPEPNAAPTAVVAEPTDTQPEAAAVAEEPAPTVQPAEEPVASPEPAPELTPMPTPAVMSIPVTDADTDAAQSATSDDNTALASAPEVVTPEIPTPPVQSQPPAPTQIQVVEPPVDASPEPSAPVPTAASPEPTPTSMPVAPYPPASDNTAVPADPISPATTASDQDQFSQPQADPLQVVMPEPTQVAATEPVRPSVEDSEEIVNNATPQATNEAEAAIHDQINSFINDQASGASVATTGAIQPDDMVAEPSSAVAQPAVAPEQTQSVDAFNASYEPLPSEPKPEQIGDSTLDTLAQPPIEPSAIVMPEQPRPQPVSEPEGTPAYTAKPHEAIREADFEPVAEDLSINSAPVITPVGDGSSDVAVVQPQQPSLPPQPELSVGATEAAGVTNPAGSDNLTAPTAPEVHPSGNDLLASAISNLSSNAPNTPHGTDGMDQSSPEDTKRVITPLPNNAPNVNQILSVEESRMSAQQAAVASVPPPQPNIAAYAPSMTQQEQSADAGAPFEDEPLDPNSISL